MALSFPSSGLLNLALWLAALAVTASSMDGGNMPGMGGGDMPWMNMAPAPSAPAATNGSLANLPAMVAGFMVCMLSFLVVGGRV